MKKHWGGRRDGAGRKATPDKREIIRINIGVYSDLLDWLNTVTDNKTDFIIGLVQLAKDQNLVIVQPDKFGQDGEPEVANWVFKIGKGERTFYGSYECAKADAIAAALELNVRLVELITREVEE